VTSVAAAGRLLRAIAIIIALVAAIDPSVTSERAGKPIVSVVTSSAPRDSALAERTARALAKEFTIVRAPFGAAAGTVIIGDQLPIEASEIASPAFALFADEGEPVATITDARLPHTAPPNSRVRIVVTSQVTGARGRTVDVALSAEGLVVDRASRVVGANNERLTIPLTFVPTASGPAPLRVSVLIAGSRQSAVADLLVDVRDQRWSVLFFDPRPSWMSTFVRRALERDPRFLVTSRVMTSRNVSTDAGRPPASLNELATLSSFDAIIVGAPDALGENDVTGLDAYMRRRGGSVVLLFDQRAAGAYQRLTSAESWQVNTDSSIVSIARSSGDTAVLRASEIMWPERLPAGAEVIASTVAASTSTKNAAAPRAIAWRLPVGAGRLVVNGALDAWRYRDRSRFDEFWQTLIAESSNASPPAVDVHLSDATPPAGERIVVDVIARDAALDDRSSERAVPTHASAALSLLDGSGASTPFKLWRADGVGHLQGVVQAPEKPGTYHITVSTDAAEAAVPLLVGSAQHVTPNERDLVATWVASRGGRAISASRIAELPAELRRAIRPASRRETWHPMRSGGSCRLRCA
jgi:hypothetical protein